MRAVLTRVTAADVVVAGETVAAIKQGFLVLVGVCVEDTRQDAQWLADRICKLRIFEDGDGKMNLAPQAVGASLLLVSNFTLYGNCVDSRRPGFTQAAKGASAQALFDDCVAACKDCGLPVQTGVFGADMTVTSVNDGPVTFILDSKERKK